MPYLLEDTDPDVLYDGKLIIMVNSHSASASEILAAALQDYARALIVGTAPSTFGKGTVQRFVNLDDQIPPKYQELGELGALKITIQKFYRINGGSTQLKGRNAGYYSSRCVHLLRNRGERRKIPYALDTDRTSRLPEKKV